MSMSYVSILFITILLFVVATGIIFLVLVYQKKQLQYTSDKEQMKARYEKEILESRLEIQEQTLRNISQEVHDNIGQVLSVVKLNLNMINCNEPKPVLQERIGDVGQLVGKVIQDLRDLSKSLDGNHIASKGLVKAIEYEFSLLKKTGAYTTLLTVEGEPYNLPEQKELILFRIFQETINNIMKHAKATHVEVLMRFQPHQFHLSIHDDGQGFDAAATDASQGLGLHNMANRSQLIGAAFHLHSQPGNGATVVIELPVAESVLL